MTETIAPGTCRNCGAALAGPYCGQCGQKDRPLNPSLFSLAGEAIAEALDVDGKLLRSIRILFTRPGFLTNALFAGRRASYVSPLRLYLVFSVILFAVSAVVANRALVMPPEGNRIDLGGGMSIWWDDARPGDRERTIAQAERQVAVRTTWLPRAMFVVLPLLALGVMVLTWRSGRRFPQHLQFTAHVQAVVFAGFALLMALPRLPSRLLCRGVEGRVGPGFAAVGCDPRSRRLHRDGFQERLRRRLVQEQSANGGRRAHVRRTLEC